MRAILALACTAAVVGTAPVAAQSTGLSVAGECAVVPILAGAIPVVEVKIGGKGPYRFAIDTGAQGHGRISRELAEELGIFVAPHELQPLGSFTAAAANEPGHVVVADVFAADIGTQGPEVGAEIAELRWITRADAEHLEVAPLARTYFLPAD